MSKTKRFAALSLAAALTLGLASCGKDGKDPSGSNAGDGKAVYRTLYASEVTTQLSGHQ